MTKLVLGCVMVCINYVEQERVCEDGLSWRRHVQDPNSQRIALWNLGAKLSRGITVPFCGLWRNKPLKWPVTEKEVQRQGDSE